MTKDRRAKKEAREVAEQLGINCAAARRLLRSQSSASSTEHDPESPASDALLRPAAD